MNIILVSLSVQSDEFYFQAIIELKSSAMLIQIYLLEVSGDLHKMEKFRVNSKHYQDISDYN